MATVMISGTIPQFKQISELSPGQAGFIVQGGGLGEIVLRAKGNYVVDLTTGDVIDTAQTIGVIVIPAGAKITITTL